MLQYKPEACELQARKGDKVRVHYRVSRIPETYAFK